LNIPFFREFIFVLRDIGYKIHFEIKDVKKDLKIKQRKSNKKRGYLRKLVLNK
tara:strand:- start:22619 stop:22777 length:159 start_codon:yes stop_codon:yes gene_type:complete